VRAATDVRRHRFLQYYYKAIAGVKPDTEGTGIQDAIAPCKREWLLTQADSEWWAP
jgi:hypothetical protein